MTEYTFFDRHPPMHEHLLTLEGEPRKALAYLPALRASIADLPETCSRFRLADVLDRGVEAVRRDARAFVQMYGAWKAPEGFRSNDSVGDKYVNPNGVHARHHAEAEMDNHLVAELVREYGWSPGDLAVRFDLPDDEVFDTVAGGGLSWGRMHDSYRQRAGNTFAHLVSETDYGAGDVAAVYGRSRDQLVAFAECDGDYTRTDGGWRREW